MTDKKQSQTNHLVHWFWILATAGLWLPGYILVIVFKTGKSASETASTFAENQRLLNQKLKTVASNEATAPVQACAEDEHSKTGDLEEINSELSMEGEFDKAVLGLLSKYQDLGLYPYVADSHYFNDTRKWLGIDESEYIYGMVDESLYRAGKLGVAFCRSGICWRGKVNDERQSLLWSELPAAVEGIQHASRKVVLSGVGAIPSSIFSSKKLSLLLKELASTVDDFETITVNPQFKTMTAYVPADGKTGISKIVGEIKSKPIYRQAGFLVVVFVLGALVARGHGKIELPPGIDQATVCKYAIAEIFGRDPLMISANTVSGVVYLKYTRSSDLSVWKTKCKLVNGNQVMWASNNDGDTKRWRDHQMDSKIYFEAEPNKIVIKQVHADRSSSTEAFALTN